ncbi:MAG: alpha/beta hydrolase, partial [Phycisphaerales bacterium JB064]
DERSPLTRLGVARVSIGAGLSWDEIVASSKAEHRDQPAPIVELLGYEHHGVMPGTLPPEPIAAKIEEPHAAIEPEAVRSWLDELNALLRDTHRPDITIYVHGYNTTFPHNTGLAAEFWHYAGRKGALMSFAWPSRHALLGYNADTANAAYATRQFRELLSFLADNTEARNIHIIAHSAGSPIAINALRELRIMHQDHTREQLLERFRIGRFVLAAPDMDLMGFFAAREDGFHEMAERVAFYANRSDRALSLSRLLSHQDRLGESVGHLHAWELEAIYHFEHTDAIDVSNAERKYGDLLGHSYYQRDPWVSGDVALFLLHGLSPEERGLVKNDQTGFWEFPADYLERLAEVSVDEGN